MKLATKYDVDMLRAIIMRHFESEWPRSLAEWEKQYRAPPPGKMRLSDCAVDYDDGTLISSAVTDYTKLPEPASAIRFAMEFSCPSVLPAAFYALSQTTPNADWEKCRKSNSSRLKAMRSARWTLLEPADLIRLLQGKEALADFLDLNLSYLTEFSNCVNRDHSDDDEDGGDDEEDDDDDSDMHSDCKKTLEKLILRHRTKSNPKDPLEVFYWMNNALGKSWSQATEGKCTMTWCCLEGYTDIRVALVQCAKNLWTSLPLCFDLQNLPK